MNDYFAKNSAIFSDEEMELLKLKQVFVAGCGGLGGSITEILTRSGIGWALQTGVCPPGAGVLHSLYGGKNTATHPGGGIAMTVFTCAAFEVSEAVNVLLGRPGSRDGKLLFFDLLTKESQIIPMP